MIYHFRYSSPPRIQLILLLGMNRLALSLHKTKALLELKISGPTPIFIKLIFPKWKKVNIEPIRLLFSKRTPRLKYFLIYLCWIVILLKGFSHMHLAIQPSSSQNKQFVLR